MDIKKINLKSTNGRLYPSFTAKNYKNYSLESETTDITVDPCNNIKKEKHELRRYQEFIGKYMSYETGNNSILLFHDTGTGKTRTAINIYSIIMMNNPNFNIFIILKASLHDKWEQEFKKWLGIDAISKNIYFCHLDSPFFGNDFDKAKKESDSSKRNIYFIDESHLFISHVLSNMNSTTGKSSKNSLSVYETILQDKRDNDCKIIMITATPAQNECFELALTFNLLRPDIFDKNKIVFEKTFLTTDNGIQILNPKMKNTFQRRIMGLVSYYFPSSSLYATKNINIIDVQMTEYQTDIYNYYEKIENEIAKKNTVSYKSPLYRIYTRQASNFVFPNINTTVNAENRPRPSKFKLSEEELNKLLTNNKDLTHNEEAYFEMLKLFETTTESYFDKIYESEKNEKYNILTDYENFKKYDKFEDCMNNEKNKSKLFHELYKCSCKYINFIFNFSKSKHVTVIYTNFIMLEGIHMIKIYLKYFGFLSYKNPDSKDFYKYAEITGEESSEDKTKSVEIEQHIDNKDGKLIKLIFFSSAGTEGIDLFNVDQEHIIEPFWNEARIIQVIGRGIRMCSHKHLPPDERHVEIYRYKTIKNNVNNKKIEIDGKIKIEKEIITDDNLLKTVDSDVENRARSKINLLESFFEPIREVAIDCNLFKNHNMVNSKYRCFQFNRESLFDKNIGPAYKESLEEDLKIDNGLNSVKSIVVSVKVIKINGINKLTNTTDIYWYEPKNGYIYDYDLHYPVGKVSIDQDGITEKINNDTYYVNVIQIPVI